MKLTDAELAKYLGIADDERWPQMVAKIDPVKRGSYEHMAQFELEWNLWQAGAGPYPAGVIVCLDG